MHLQEQFAERLVVVPAFELRLAPLLVAWMVLVYWFGTLGTEPEILEIPQAMKALANRLGS